MMKRCLDVKNAAAIAAIARLVAYCWVEGSALHTAQRNSGHFLTDLITIRLIGMRVRSIHPHDMQWHPFVFGIYNFEYL
jgi:hypothetical protein